MIPAKEERPIPAVPGGFSNSPEPGIPRANPELLAKIRRQQEAVAGQKQKRLLCPYCHHCAVIVYEDARGHIQTKCQVCKKEFIFSLQ